MLQLQDRNEPHAVPHTLVLQRLDECLLNLKIHRNDYPAELLPVYWDALSYTRTLRERMAENLGEPRSGGV